MIPNKCENPVVGAPRRERHDDTKRASFLIPVDSSANAYNSLTYALKLARACNARIHLVHVADLYELPESGNPFAIHRMLGSIERKAKNCVTALKELIEDSGIEVLSHNAVIGNIDALLSRQIECLAPDLVIVGRDTFRKTSTTRMLRTSPSPVLVVPGSAEPVLPENIALYTDHTKFSENSLTQLLRIVRSTTGEFSILSLAKNRDRASIISGPQSKSSDFQTHHHLLKDGRNSESIQTFAELNGVDLLCTTFGYPSPLHRLLGRSYTTTLVYSLKIPVMVMRPGPRIAM